MYANRARLCEIIDCDYKDVEVPDWGMVRIRSLSAAERLSLSDAFSEHAPTPKTAFQFYARLIALSLVDESGLQLFDSTCDDDLAILQSKNWNRLEFIAKQIMEFNAITKEEPVKN